MTNSNLKFKSVKSDQLYYGLYQYSASFQLQECWVFRYSLEHDAIDKRLTQQQEWRDKMRARWPAYQTNHSPGAIDEVTRANVHSMADFLTGIATPYKIIIEHKTMRIYTNDLNIVQAIEHIPFVQRRRYARVIVDRPKDTIKLKKPKHQYRSYFKEIRVTTEEREAIGRFLFGQPGIRIGQGLKEWLDGSSRAYASKYTREYFFVDYDHANWLIMLALVRPGLIRRTMRIIAK